MEVPRYFGSLDDIINALLLEDSPREKGPEHLVPSSLNPIDPIISDSHPASNRKTDPAPWFGASIESAVSLIVSELSLRQIGQQMQDGPVKNELIARVDATIAEFLDDYCGNSGHAALFPWPGPPPWISPTVSKLSTIASTMQDKELKDSVLNVAANMALKSFSYPGRG